MSACDADRLEALVEGRLEGVLAAEARAHVAACKRCSVELAWLRAERRVFDARGRGGSPPGPPPLAAVIAGVRRERWSRSILVRSAPWLGLVAAAAAVLVFASREPSAPEVIAVPSPADACFWDDPNACWDDPRSLAVEVSSHTADLVFASAPVHLQADAQSAEGSCSLQAVEADGTCSSLRPLDEERALAYGR